MATTTAREVPAETNEVVLTGRISGPVTSKELPSGDELVTLRVVVARGEGEPVDTIDLSCWTAGTRRAARRLAEGDRIRVEGSLHRRFFRTPAGAASRYDVEVRRLVRDRR